MLKKLKVDAEDEAAVVDSEAAVEVENVELRGVICVITVTKMVIMQKIVQNRRRRGRHDFKMDDALYATKKDTKRLIVQIDVLVEVVVSTKEEAEVRHQEELVVQEVDLEVTLILEETDLVDNSKLFL